MYGFFVPDVINLGVRLVPVFHSPYVKEKCG